METISGKSVEFGCTPIVSLAEDTPSFMDALGFNDDVDSEKEKECSPWSKTSEQVIASPARSAITVDDLQHLRPALDLEAVGLVVFMWHAAFLIE